MLSKLTRMLACFQMLKLGFCGSNVLASCRSGYPVGDAKHDDDI